MITEQLRSILSGLNRRTIKTFLINYQYIDSGNNLSNLLQRYPICGLAFLGADEVGIDLGCADALVGEHLRHCVDVRTQGDLQCGKGVAEAVERYVFADTCGLHPGV